MSENKLPAWAIDGLRDAGLSAEGWESNLTGDTVDLGSEYDGVTVSSYEHENGNAGVTAESRALPLPDAFRLAARLAAALENNPGPRVVELQAERERWEIIARRTKGELNAMDPYGREMLEAEVARLRGALAECVPLLEAAFLTGFITGNIDPEIAEILKQARAALSEATNGE